MLARSRCAAWASARAVCVAGAARRRDVANGNGRRRRATGYATLPIRAADQPTVSPTAMAAGAAGAGTLGRSPASAGRREPRPPRRVAAVSRTGTARQETPRRYTSLTDSPRRASCRARARERVAQARRACRRSVRPPSGAARAPLSIAPSNSLPLHGAYSGDAWNRRAMVMRSDHSARRGRGRARHCSSGSQVAGSPTRRPVPGGSRAGGAVVERTASVRQARQPRGEGVARRRARATPGPPPRTGPAGGAGSAWAARRSRQF